MTPRESGSGKAYNRPNPIGNNSVISAYPRNAPKAPHAELKPACKDGLKQEIEKLGELQGMQLTCPCDKLPHDPSCKFSTSDGNILLQGDVLKALDKTIAEIKELAKENEYVPDYQWAIKEILKALDSGEGK